MSHLSPRRSFLQRTLGLGAGLLAAPRLFAATGDASSTHAMAMPSGRTPSTARHAGVPAITPDVGDLPYSLDGNVKVFHLTAQVIRQQIAPNKTLDLWGYNGSAPGPTIQVNQGDRMRVVFKNELPEPTSMHWHGFEDAIAYDGMPGISQEPVKPGETFLYEFDIHQAGTFFYHSHMAMQEMAGMLGAVVMHPKEPYMPHCDKDFVLHFQEYAVLPDNTVPNTMNMEYNWLVINGKAGPACTPLVVRQGDRVRIRMVNLGMDHHPIHLHGHTFRVTGTEGGRIPEAGWWPGNTVLLGVAQARDVEFVANNPGDWMLHCHLPHHMMNQMSSNVGPMSRVASRMQGMPAGLSMDTAMGMLSGGAAPLAEENGPSLGRGMGFGSTAATNETNGPASQRAMTQAMPGMGSMQSGDVAPGADRVPNFPQDAYMESAMMDMESSPMLQTPENYGLRPGWSPYMQGMMTFLRVLPPARYDEVIARMRAASRPNDPYQSILRG